MNLNVIFWLSMVAATANTYLSECPAQLFMSGLLIIVGAVALSCNIAADKVIKALTNREGK